MHACMGDRKTHGEERSRAGKEQQKQHAAVSAPWEAFNFSGKIINLLDG